MPYSNPDTLKVFLSYASEDEQIADALAKTLRQAFFRVIDITMMNEFSIGKNWRQIIENSILDTDIFIAIESGQLKPSHSYTAKEVGMFDISKRLQPKMKSFPHMDRLMIPFAVLTHSTAATNEFEGVDIDPDTLYDLRFDPDNLTEVVAQYDRDDFVINENDKMLKLLRDIDYTINLAKGSAPIDPKNATARDKALKGFAHALSQDLLVLLLSRKKFVSRPKTKLIISVPAASYNTNDALSKSTIRWDGNFEDMFGPARNKENKCGWEEFVNGVDIDVAFQWNKALTSVLQKATAYDKNLSSVQNRKAPIFLDEASIISFDRSKIFRLVTSELSIYYNNDIEIHVYAVPILRTKDFGDPNTTLLLHAAEIGLGYRFTFLEKNSPFSPEVFAAENPSKIKTRISDMIDRITWLIVRSEDYHLHDPVNIVATIGSDSVVNISDNYRLWEEAKNILSNIAKKIIAKEKTSFDDQKSIIDAVREFVSHTKDMNAMYTAEVLLRLRAKIFSDETLANDASGGMG